MGTDSAKQSAPLPGARPWRLEGFRTWSDRRKSILILLAAVAVDLFWIGLSVWLTRTKLGDGTVNYAALSFARVFFLTALCCYIALLLIGWALERADRDPALYAYLTMVVISVMAVVNIFLVGSVSTVGMAAIPVFVILAGSIYGARRAAFAFGFLALLLGIGFYLEWRGIVPFAPLFKPELAPYYRSGLVYTISALAVVFFSLLGVTVVQWVERELESSREKLRKAHGELEQTDALRRELLAACSQDLRWPAQAVIEHAGAIEREYGALSGAEVEAVCDSLRQAGKTLVQHADTVLAVSRSQLGDLQLRKSPVSLEAVARSVYNAYAPLALQKHVVLELDRGDGGALNRLDGMRIEQLLSELVANAIRHTPGGGRVLIRLSDTGAHQSIEVEDTGRGLPSDLIPHLFDPLDSPLPEDRRTRGVGLPLCKMIVDRHGGEIEVDPQHSGGALFRIVLPVERPRVLLVSESSAERGVLRRHLALLGNRVFEALSGHETLAEAQRVRPDLILLDTDLDGELSALDLLRRLKAGVFTREIPILLYTRDAAHVIDAVREGCSDYILKPGDASELNQHIRMIFNR